MNEREYDILNTMVENPYVNQRTLAKTSGFSLGMINKSVKNLITAGYLHEDLSLSEKTGKEMEEKAPKNAIILAAGFGMRMVPINTAAPKGLLEVHGEILIERLIRQLLEVGITDITVVVGFMKERFEYLIDEYGVDLVVNLEFLKKNNLHTLNLVRDRIENTYIVPSNLWCEKNPFHHHEFYSWYMVGENEDEESDVRVNRNGKLVLSPEGNGNQKIGISYLLKKEADFVRDRLEKYDADRRYDNSLWETTLFEGKHMIVAATTVDESEVVEINTYEQLKEIDSYSNHLKSESLELIAEVFNTTVDQIQDISILKKGMTNRSFLFSVNGKKYIMRIPGEGTDRLINRHQEAQVYEMISGKGLCDDPVYINPENGYKITAFLEGIRVCDTDNVDDLTRCMTILRRFHEMELKVNYSFDLFRQIDVYESFWNGTPSVYKDYKKTKANVMSLQKYIEKQERKYCLTHIDAVPDNFIFYQLPSDEEEKLQLTDWEYAGMQDPHLDIAMFCVYSLYDRAKIDRLIDIYFEGDCPHAVRTKIYCYIAACGLLWSNWTEYKNALGVEFGEYGMRQYRYAIDYYRIATEEMSKEV